MHIIIKYRGKTVTGFIYLAACHNIRNANSSPLSMFSFLSTSALSSGCLLSWPQDGCSNSPYLIPTTIPRNRTKNYSFPLSFFILMGEKKKIPEPPQLTSPHISLAKLCHVPRPDQSLAIGNGTTDVYLDKNSANYSPKVSPPSVFECPVS